MAELIGVIYQQPHKHENGVNGISAVELHSIAQALAVDVGFLFESPENDSPTIRRRSSASCWISPAFLGPFGAPASGGDLPADANYGRDVLAARSSDGAGERSGWLEISSCAAGRPR
jgi:hypothetical protein